MKKEKKEPSYYYLYIYLGDWVYYSERRRNGALVMVLFFFLYIFCIYLNIFFTYILVIGCITVRGGGKGHRSGGDWWPPWLECLAHQTWSSFLLFLSFCRTHRVPTYPWYSSSPPSPPSPPSSPWPVSNYYYKCLIYHIQASGSPQPIHFLKAHDVS